MSMIYYAVTDKHLIKIEPEFILEETDDAIVFVFKGMGSTRFKKRNLHEDFNAAKEDLVCRLQRKNAKLYAEVNRNLNAIHRLQRELSESTFDGHYNIDHD